MNPITRTVAACSRIEMRMWTGLKTTIHPYLLLTILTIATMAGLQAATGATVAAAVAVAVIGVTLIAGAAITHRR